MRFCRKEHHRSARARRHQHAGRPLLSQDRQMMICCCKHISKTMGRMIYGHAGIDTTMPRATRHRSHTPLTPRREGQRAPQGATRWPIRALPMPSRRIFFDDAQTWARPLLSARMALPPAAAAQQQRSAYARARADTLIEATYTSD